VPGTNINAMLVCTNKKIELMVPGTFISNSIMKHRISIATIFAGFIVLGLARTAWTAEEALNEKEPPLCSFQIPKNGDDIVLPLTLEKQEVLICFDTGSSGCCFDTTLRKTLGKYINTEIVGTEKAETFMEKYEPPVA
jgi:hypothetical protein